MNKAIRYASVATSAAALVAAPLAVAPGAQAAPYTNEAVLHINATLAQIGAEIRLIGKGFNEGELVFIKLKTPQRTLLKLRVGTNGTFEDSFVVPDVPEGTHTIKAKGKQSKAVATAPLTVQD